MSCVAFFSSGIGNFIEYTPALQALASMHDGFITLCIGNNEKRDPRSIDLRNIMEAMPFVSEVIHFEECIKRTFDEYFYTAWTCSAEMLTYFKSKHPYPNETWNHEKTHETDYYFNIVKKYYGYTGSKPKQFCPYDVIEKPVNKIRIGVCNGGFGDIAIMKKWNYFSQLCYTLKGYYGDTIELVKIGYQKELSNIDTYNIDYTIGHTLLDTASIIKSLDLFIVTDTGNMHISDALQTPMIVLWGGTSFIKNCPINGKGIIINKHLSCQPCHAEGKYMQCTQVPCMNNISVGDVFCEVKKFLKGK